MSKEQSPAFQFYAAEYLADENVQVMSLDDEGCYIRLLAFCWREGSIPSDPALLSKLCKGMTPSNIVLGCFNHPSENASRLLHPRLEVERQKQEEWRKKSALGGKHSAHKRKHNNELNKQQGGCEMVPTKRQPKVNSSSSTSSSIAPCENPPIVPRGEVCEIGKKCNRKFKECSEAFELFWSAYPRHDPPRKQSRKSWCSQYSAGLEMENLLRWIGIAKQRWIDPKYIPMPTTWLNQRRWEGDLPAISKSVNKQDERQKRMDNFEVI